MPLDDTITVCIVLAASGAGLALLLWIEKTFEEIREQRRRRKRREGHRRQYMRGARR
jgi:hypothetical protein